MSRAIDVAILLFLLAMSCAIAGGQTFQFLPEVDVHSTIHSDQRFTFQAKETREAGNPTQAEVGPSLDFFLKPLVRLKNVAVFDLDQAKSRPLQLSVGYRYVPSPDKPAVQRAVLVVTPRLPLAARILVTDRNRADLDWSNGTFSWRYRNRVTFERRIELRSYHPAAYLSAEAFYQSRYQKWGTTAIYAGFLFPVRKHAELDPYYEHQNITVRRPNQQLNQFGLILNLHF